MAGGPAVGVYAEEVRWLLEDFKVPREYQLAWLRAQEVLPRNEPAAPAAESLQIAEVKSSASVEGMM